MFYWFKGLLVPWVYQLLKFRIANQKKCLELPAAKSQFGQQFPSGTACGTCQHLRAAWTQKVHAGILKPSYFRVSHKQNPRTNTRCRNVVGFFSSHVLHLFSVHPKKKGIRKAMRRTAVIEQYWKRSAHLFLEYRSQFPRSWHRRTDIRSLDLTSLQWWLQTGSGWEKWWIWTIISMAEKGHHFKPPISDGIFGIL